MSWEPAYTCDFCAKDRREDANHWYVVWIARNGVFMVAPWDLVSGRNDPAYSHVCGRGCVIRAAERFMDAGSLDDPRDIPQ
jgi:hypothetical protein